ncbi:hypothetical protein AB1Y20_012602 [Prymnesium parvum]|uniref:Mis18 domain-containing protein n=1 Tax=Prymnesium parvum TaxID=97485 RepID=A0AB34IIX8_PRYPA
MERPFILTCHKCRQVISDSNQLLATVPSLDALVLDAIVGVRIDPTDEREGAAAFGRLSCHDCHTELGRVYSAAAEPLQHVVHRPEAPRYTLHRGALGSYVMGSAKEQHDRAHGVRSDGGEAEGAWAARDGAGGEASENVLVQQLMRVVLGLDQRLKALEQLRAKGEERAAEGGEEGDGEAGRKRAR